MMKASFFLLITGLYRESETNHFLYLKLIMNALREITEIQYADHRCIFFFDGRVVARRV